MNLAVPSHRTCCSNASQRLYHQTGFQACRKHPCHLRSRLSYPVKAGVSTGVTASREVRSVYERKGAALIKGLQPCRSRHRTCCTAFLPANIPTEFLHMGAGTLTSTLTAAVKLAFLCWLVARLRQLGKLPPNTAPVLSQVTFNLAIPCLLFTRLTQTISLDNPALLGVPLMAVCQVCVGALLAKLAVAVLSGDYPTALAPFGWHPRNPPAASAAIAQTAATAMGNPAAAAALLPAPPRVSPSLAGLITLMCSFGNSFSLPLVFLLTLLPAAYAGAATAYTALFLMAWSPLFWFSCSWLLPSDAQQRQDGAAGREAGPAVTAGPSAGAPGSTGRPAPSLSSSFTLLNSSYSRTVSVPGPSAALRFQPEPQGPIREVWDHVRTRAHTIWQAAAPYLNPPTAATLVALLLVLIPGLPALLRSTPAQATQQLLSEGVPVELVALLGALRACYDMLDVLGASTLALSGIVLAASLLGAGSSGAGRTGQASSSSSSEAANGSRDLGSATISEEGGGAAVERPLEVLDTSAAEPMPGPARLQRFQPPLLHLLVPADQLQRQAMLLVGSTRLVLMPMAGLALWKAGEMLGCVPVDPVCALAVLLQSMMPPAQNLVVYLQLNEANQKLAPLAAQLLVRLYILAIVPITFWVTVCLGMYPLPL